MHDAEMTVFFFSWGRSAFGPERNFSEDKQFSADAETFAVQFAYSAPEHADSNFSFFVLHRLLLGWL